MDFCRVQRFEEEIPDISHINSGAFRHVQGGSFGTAEDSSRSSLGR
jgi:hypothetical protein